MANIKSAKKRILVTKTRTARNKAIKSKVKTYIKKVDAAIAANDKTAANEALRTAISEINKATFLSGSDNSLRTNSWGPCIYIINYKISVTQHLKGSYPINWL